MSVYLVTGGAGFIGSHLVDALVEGGRRVRVLDNLSTGSLENFADSWGRFEWVRGDVTDLDAVRHAAEGADVVFHQAALASVPRSVADPLATHHACAEGTMNVLLAARDAGARRVVYAASSSAYGNGEGLPKREDDLPAPLSPYAAAKLAGEYYCAAFTEVYGLETVRLRYFNVFGPRQAPDNPYAAVVPRFLRAMLRGESPLIHGDGHQSRDFTPVADVVRANLLAAEAPAAAGKVYNIARGGRVSLLDLVKAINRLLGTRLEPRFGPPRPGDVRHSQADITRARQDLGYRPRVGLNEGLRATLDQLRERPEFLPFDEPVSPAHAELPRS